MTPKILLIVSAVLVCQPTVAAPTKTSDSTAQSLRLAIGSILQADGATAREQLLAIPVSDLDSKDARFQSCALSRLSQPPSETKIVSPLTRKLDQFTKRLVMIYQNYWYESAAAPKRRAELEKTLLRDLNSLLGRSLATIDDTEPLIAARLRQNGFYILMGQTGYLYELMIWTREDKRTETVTLPEGGNPTTVFYIDKFVSLGWGNYLTCDRSGTGGWTDEAGLHAVVPNYDSLTDENFRINFLAHESQHFADKLRYKTIQDWELEYRAKLVELAYAKVTKDVILSNFTSNQGDDTADSHSYANKRILTALRSRLQLRPEEKLSSVSVQTLQEAAIAELRADTKQRTQASK